MRLFKKPLRVYSTIALAIAAIIISCDSFKDTENDYKIFALITCDGSTTTNFNSMTVNYYIDKQYPFTDIKVDTSPAGSPQSSFTFPKKITTITITATKANSDSTLNVIIYKNTSIVKYVNLPSCAATITSCTNTISINYDVNEDKTKAAAGTSTTSTSSSSTSSTSSSTSSTSTGSSSTSSGSGSSM